MGARSAAITVNNLIQTIKMDEEWIKEKKLVDGLLKKRTNYQFILLRVLKISGAPFTNRA